MDNQKRLLRDRLQNLLIAALSISAIYLFILTQAGPLNLHLPELDLSSPAVEELPSDSSLLQELDWPVTLVVNDGAAMRRYQQLSTAASEFTAVEGLLEDLFRQDISSLPVSLESFQQALTFPGVYVSFPDPIPLCLLAERLGLPSTSETRLQRLLLAVEGNAVRFYFCDGQRYFYSPTALAVTELLSTAEAIGGDICRFSFAQESSPLHPLTVLPAELPQYTLLSAEFSSETSGFLSFFGFNAHTTNRYVDASGTEVIVESPRRLSISPLGRVSYLGSASYAPDHFVLSTQEEPTLNELVDGAYGLLTQLAPDSGELRFYLSSAEYDHDSGSCTLRFSRMAGGLPLLSGDGESAAEFHIEDGVVINCSFLSRSYTVSDIPSLLLPLPQAAAIAAQYEGREMILSYVDSGGDSAAVSWLMR